MSRLQGTCTGVESTVATESKVKLIPPKYFVAFVFVLILIGTDDFFFALIFTWMLDPKFDFFAFAFVILKAINSEIILFRFALISVSMVVCRWRKNLSGFLDYSNGYHV